MYCSEETQLFQSQPIYSTDGFFRDNSWNTSIEGYVNEARRLVGCIELNAKLGRFHYPWGATINFEIVQSLPDIKTTWAKVCRNLRRLGIVCLWVREITRTNKIHYHLLVRSQHSRSQLQDILDSTVPESVPHHVYITKLNHKSQFWYPRYITKAKVQTELSRDKYASKRILFKPKLGITKYGVIGKFWIVGENKQTLWKRIVEREKTIAQNRQDVGLQSLVSWFGCDPPEYIVRRLAMQLEARPIQDWIGKLRQPHPCFLSS